MTFDRWIISNRAKYFQHLIHCNEAATISLIVGRWNDAVFHKRYLLTHWGGVTHICVSKLTNIGSENGLSPGRRQAIIWTSAGILWIGPLGTNFSENLIGIQIFSFKKNAAQNVVCEMASILSRPQCVNPTVWGLDFLGQIGKVLGGNALTPVVQIKWSRVIYERSVQFIWCFNEDEPGKSKYILIFWPGNSTLQGLSSSNMCPPSITPVLDNGLVATTGCHLWLWWVLSDDYWGKRLYILLYDINLWHGQRQTPITPHHGLALTMLKYLWSSSKYQKLHFEVDIQYCYKYDIEYWKHTGEEFLFLIGFDEKQFICVSHWVWSYK